MRCRFFVQQKTQNKIFSSPCVIFSVVAQYPFSRNHHHRHHERCTASSVTLRIHARESERAEVELLALSEKSPRGFHEWISPLDDDAKKMFSKRDKSRLKNCPSRHKVILEWNNNSIRPSRSYHKHRWTLSEALRELFRCFSVS